MADLYALTPGQDYSQMDFLPEFTDPTTDSYVDAHYSHEPRYDDPNYPAAVYDPRAYVRAPCDMNPIPARYPPQMCGTTDRHCMSKKKLVDDIQTEEINILGSSFEKYTIALFLIVIMLIGNIILTCVVAMRLRSSAKPMGFI
jgi:hypothetical protein